MTVLRISNPLRKRDDWGSGDFAASRGGKYHRGRDYLYEPGDSVRCPVEASVIRLGYPYNDSDSNSRYRLIEMLHYNAETGAKIMWRFFYVYPAVAVGELVMPGQMLGTAQDVAARYNDPDKQPMGNHIHVECIVDPETFFEAAMKDRGTLWV
jgi:hypothetical protein